MIRGCGIVIVRVYFLQAIRFDLIWVDIFDLCIYIFFIAICSVLYGIFTVLASGLSHVGDVLCLFSWCYPRV